jgi:hypothetical protein
MSQTTTLILFPETAYQNPGNGSPYTLTGESRPAAAYYLGNQDLQTVNIKTSSCTANIVIQATLAATPTENDWFKVYELPINTDTPSQNGGNVSTYTNIEGNFVYMRAKIEDFQNGVVQFVKLSY